MALHMIPLNDSKRHHYKGVCPCKPKVDEATGVIEHNAFDKRECIEALYTQLMEMGFKTTGEQLRKEQLMQGKAWATIQVRED